MSSTLRFTFATAAAALSSGGLLAYYLSDNNTSKTTQCKPNPNYYTPDTHINPTSEFKSWNDNWDNRSPTRKHCIDNTTSSTDKKDENITSSGSEATSNSSEEEEKKVKKPTATRHVFLVRHGQYVHSKEGKQFKILTELGRQQAKVTGERLNSLDINFDRLVVSTVVRAQETGNIIGDILPDDLPRIDCSLLKEGSPYPVEPYRADLDTPKWNLHTFVDNPRIEGAFRKYIHRADVTQEKDSYDLLVCHGNVIRYFVCRALQFPPEGWLRMSLGNASVTWLMIRPSGSVYLKSLGDVGHLPPEMISFS